MCHEQNGEAEVKICVHVSTEEKDDHSKKQRSDIHYSSKKNMRSMHSSEKIEELLSALEGYRWDAILLNETWRLNRLKYGRHIINTSSWELENTTTNTESELC